MSGALVFWFVMVLLQKDGVVGLGYGEKANCEEARIELKADPDVLAVSECTSSVLTPNKAETEKT